MWRALACRRSARGIDHDRDPVVKRRLAVAKFVEAAGAALQFAAMPGGDARAIDGVLHREAAAEFRASFDAPQRRRRRDRTLKNGSLIKK